jgi:hypothetical protein
MGHFIYAIVAPAATADAISNVWPELPRLDKSNGFAVFPVDAELIDDRIGPEDTPIETENKSMLLTFEFHELLRELSRDGQLAYVETEYFGGLGGQCALVCRDGNDLMSLTWDSIGPINDALALIGMPRGTFRDLFAAVGFDKVRSNNDILEIIADQSTDNDRSSED